MKPDSHKLKKSDYPGKFIVFEGLDGSGLNTQSSLLIDFLNKEVAPRGFAGAQLTKEPTQGGLIGGLINAQLDGVWSSSNICLQLLFTADRAYHLEKKIIPMLKKGIWVVCDRYFFSTVAFGQLNDVTEEWLLTLQQYFLMPDLTFIIKVSPNECVRRINDGRFRAALFEKEHIFEKVWGNYEKLARRFENKNVKIVDGEKPVEDVSKEIKKITKKILKI